MTFREMTNTSAASRTAVINSLEASNGEPIVGSSGLPSKEQLRQSIAGSFAAQNRAVTEQDYKAVVYSMPPQFGSVKRCGMYRDSDSFRRNLNLYVISEDRDGYLVQTNNTIKQNLKVWLGQNKPINDTVDILNAKIVNIQIDFTAVSAVGTDKYDIQVNAINRVKEAYKAKMDIGQPFDISQVYNILNKTRGIVDVTKVRVINKFGGEYSSIGYDIRQNTTPDGRYVNVPSNVILEIKFLNTDIKGTIT
jgi:hypothetical protein